LIQTNVSLSTLLVCSIFFFFSSRRRHTRWPRDWSSDVCSSDLGLASINVAVDACNVVSLHSGLPVSVVDLDKARAPFRVGLAPAGASYVFNASGQAIDLGGLLCLFDADGPSANAVKDAQRTKTGPETRRTLSVLWGTVALPGRASQAEAWYRELLERSGAKTEAM